MSGISAALLLKNLTNFRAIETQLWGWQTHLLLKCLSNARAIRQFWTQIQRLCCWQYEGSVSPQGRVNDLVTERLPIMHLTGKEWSSIAWQNRMSFIIRTSWKIIILCGTLSVTVWIDTYSFQVINDIISVKVVAKIPRNLAAFHLAAFLVLKQWVICLWVPYWLSQAGNKNWQWNCQWWMGAPVNWLDEMHSGNGWGPDWRDLLMCSA